MKRSNDRSPTELSRSHFLMTGTDIKNRVLYLNGMVDSDMLGQFTIGAQAIDLSAGPFTVRLTTNGGSVEDGLAIYDMIRQHRDLATIQVVGYAHSMGAYILQAAGRRSVTANGTVMAHWGSQSVEAESQETFKRKIDYGKRLDNICDHILLERIREKNPAATLEYVVKRTKSDWFMSPEEALAEGLIDEIIGSGPSLGEAKAKRAKKKKIEE